MVGQRGRWFDGQVARQRDVTVTSTPRCLFVAEDDGEVHQIARDAVTWIGRDRDEVRLGHRTIDGWRLVLTAPFADDVVAELPRRGAVEVTPRRRATMAGWIGLCAVVTVAIGLVILAPQMVARHMPMTWERKLGTAFDVPIGATRCDDRQAQAALWTIVDRLDPQARRDGFTIELLDLDQANAAALPGGRIVVLNGLFAKVSEPDAVAGIVAHEIAHVRRRHVAANVVRQLGLGTIITLAGGGAVAGNANQVVSLKFTRDAEAEADADAIAMLARAGISPLPTARAFVRFAKREGRWPEWLESHPSSRGRAARFAAATKAGADDRPVLDESAARALFGACRDGA